MSVGTCPADCTLTANIKGEGNHKPAYRLHDGSVGKYSGRFADTVTIDYFYFWNLGGLKCSYYLCYVCVCLPVEIPNRTNQFSRNLGQILASLNTKSNDDDDDNNNNKRHFTRHLHMFRLASRSNASQTFRPETAATLITHFMHKKPLTLPPYVFCS